MGKVTKTLEVSWDWTGDPARIIGWNVHLTQSTQTPYGADGASYGHWFVPAPPDPPHAWPSSFSHSIQRLLLDGGITLVAWVQQVFAGGDSAWLSSTGVSVADDGLATAAEITETAERKWAGESGADKTSTVIDGGLVTTGTVQLKDSADVTKAGMTAATAGDSAVRLWAGATYASRANAPFRVTQGGKMTASNAEISGMQLVGGSSAGFVMTVGAKLTDPANAPNDPDFSDCTGDTGLYLYIYQGSGNGYSLSTQIDATPSSYGSNLYMDCRRGDVGIHLEQDNGTTPGYPLKITHTGPGAPAWLVGETYGPDISAVYALTLDATSETSGGHAIFYPQASTSSNPTHTAPQGTVAMLERTNLSDQACLHVNVDGGTTWKRIPYA